MADTLRASALVAQGHRFINQKRALPINLLPARDILHASRELLCCVECRCPEFRTVLLLKTIRLEQKWVPFINTMLNLPYSELQFSFIDPRTKIPFCAVEEGFIWVKPCLWPCVPPNEGECPTTFLTLCPEPEILAVSSLKTLSSPITSRLHAHIPGKRSAVCLGGLGEGCLVRLTNAYSWSGVLVPSCADRGMWNLW